MVLAKGEDIAGWVDLGSREFASNRLFSAQRLKCGTAEKVRPERSELAALSAVATTDLLGRSASPGC